MGPPTVAEVRAEWPRGVSPGPGQKAWESLNPSFMFGSPAESVWRFVAERFGLTGDRGIEVEGPNGTPRGCKPEWKPLEPLMSPEIFQEQGSPLSGSLFVARAPGTGGTNPILRAGGRWSTPPLVLERAPPAPG